MAPHHDELPWYAHIMKVRELYDRQALDGEKLSAEIAKSIFSNLFLLNAGGIGSVPAISAFFLGSNTEVKVRFEFLSAPVYLFISGAIVSLAAQFVTYINYQSFAATARSACRVEQAAFNKIHPVYEVNEDFAALVESELLNGRRDNSVHNRWLHISYWIAMFLGFSSLFLFIFGCYYFTDTIRKFSH